MACFFNYKKPYVINICVRRENENNVIFKLYWKKYIL